MGGPDFMEQFTAGWRLGIDKREAARRDQMMAEAQKREEYERASEQARLNMQREELSLRLKKMKQEDALKKLELQQQSQLPQGLSAPTAADTGITQAVPDVGPPVEQINVPQPMGTVPFDSGDVQVPILTGRQQEELRTRDMQRKMQEALGMKVAEHRAVEPFKIADDNRTAARMEAAAERSDSRAAARENAREGKQSLAQENRLRAEFNRESQKLREGLVELDRFTAPVRKSIEAGKQPSSADQFALIYAFNKALDPGSTVREGEFANARGIGAGVSERAYLALEKLRSGAQLSPGQVTEMMDTIGRARGATEDALGQITSKYGELAAGYGIDASKVTPLGGSSSSGGDWQTVGGVRVRRKGK